MAYRNSVREHAFQRFHKDLKAKNFDNIIFMYGEEEYLIRWAAKSIAEPFTGGAMTDMDFVRIEEAENADTLLQACDTFSLFSEKRVVWAEDFPPLMKKNAKGFTQDQINRVLSYIEDPNPMTILIFSCVKPEDGSNLVKHLKKGKSVYDFSRLDKKQLLGFAEKRFSLSSVSIDRDILGYLIDETGYFNRESQYTLYNLENDINKLIAYCDGRKVTEYDIDTTLKGDLDRFAFDFLDAVTAGRKDRALRLLNNITAGGTDVYSILGLLVSQFELMTEAKELAQEGAERTDIPKILKVNPYRVQKALSFADKFSMSGLKEILGQLYQVDRNIKLGVMNQQLALEMLIGRM